MRSYWLGILLKGGDPPRLPTWGLVSKTFQTPLKLDTLSYPNRVVVDGDVGLTSPSISHTDLGSAPNCSGCLDVGSNEEINRMKREFEQFQQTLIEQNKVWLGPHGSLSLLYSCDDFLNEAFKLKAPLIIAGQCIRS